MAGRNQNHHPSNIPKLWHHSNLVNTYVGTMYKTASAFCWFSLAPVFPFQHLYCSLLGQSHRRLAPACTFHFSNTGYHIGLQCSAEKNTGFSLLLVISSPRFSFPYFQVYLLNDCPPCPFRLAVTQLTVFSFCPTNIHFRHQFHYHRLFTC